MPLYSARYVYACSHTTNTVDMVDENVQHWDMINERLVYGWQKILENNIFINREMWENIIITSDNIFQYFHC